MVLLLLADEAAFFTLRLAAAFCFELGMNTSEMSRQARLSHLPDEKASGVLPIIYPRYKVAAPRQIETLAAPTSFRKEAANVPAGRPRAPPLRERPGMC
jgi:hypothetical protein